MWAEPGPGFVEWLQAPGGIFWIQGKAGSGKSTLMKYLFNVSRILSYLANSRIQGAPPTSSKLSESHSLGEARTLCLAGFFFSAQGSTLERSLMGLLMSILSQVLEKFPALIATAFSGLWKDMQGPSNKCKKPLSWSINDLRNALQQVAHNHDLQARGDVCLFIDGLDEYDGDHAELAETLDSIILPSFHPQLRFKACLASRPLTAFDRCFKGHPGLRLQDLTARDIRHYVTSKLNLHEDQDCLIGYDDRSRYINIVEEVVCKSSGVFLWVTLTVRSLETGLDNGDNISELKARLDETPTDLQGLYLATLHNIEPRYRWQAADLLRIVRDTRRTLTLLELAFASDDPTLAIAQRIRPERDDTKLLAKCRVMEKRLKSRCGALLYISKAPIHDQETSEGPEVTLGRKSPSLQDEGSVLTGHTSSGGSETEFYASSSQCSADEIPWAAAMKRTVKFLHLSLQEFLDLSSSWQALDADRKSVPDPYIYLIIANIGLLNVYDMPWTGTDVESDEPPVSRFSYYYGGREYLIREIMHYGLLVKEDSSDILVGLLDKLHATMTEYASEPSEPWFIHLLDVCDYDATGEFSSLGWPKEWHSNFLALAAYFGLLTYVRAKTEADPAALAKSYGRPLACYAIHPA